jgi:starch-binding outer membrane protein, SusD/RagB family
MKKYNLILLKALAVVFLLSGSISCNDDYLNEKPLDFLSAENFFTTEEGFEAAVIGLHERLRDNFWGTTDGQNWFILPGGFGTDFGFNAFNLETGTRNNYGLVTSSDGFAKEWWQKSYSLIQNANVIITRAESAEAEDVSQDVRNIAVAKAKFFRAFAYRILVQLFGDVPINREEIAGVKLDFARDPKADVYNFIIEDLEYASEYIPANPELDGMVSKAAADHLLAEIYICVERWDDAIAAASRVINNPDYELMTERYGNHLDKGGDVYWDLFRVNNQNRGSGNKEAILVLQIEYPTPGGGSESHPSWPGHVAERAWGPQYFVLKDPDGKNGMSKVDSLGSPVGFIRPTHHVLNTIWQSDWDDMRNSKWNIQRDWYYNNTNSAFFGEKVTTLFDPASDSIRNYFPYFKKITHPEGWPEGNGKTGRLWRDLYVMRLAETYLLRAEAKLGKGDKPGAAADINIVRARANATPVEAADVDIDYILDERARELITEEFRLLTLMRLELLYERTKKYNWVAGPTIEPYNNLWPIPQSEIDRNFGAKLEQNPGYD